MEAPDAVSARPHSVSRISRLLLLLNVILLGCLLYTNFGRALTPSGGVSLILANDLPWAITELKLSYPGGSFTLPQLESRKEVGTSVSQPRRFDATISFKGPGGVTCQETFPIKPLDELLIAVHILPILEESVIKSAESTEGKIFKPSPSHVRILTSYQGPVLYN
jgi:hypothetical protein